MLVCAYCGGRFHADGLTREHIVPTSQWRARPWVNCITACRGCNGRKGNRLPEEAHMSLLYLPYVPSLHEDMILRGPRIPLPTDGVPAGERAAQQPAAGARLRRLLQPLHEPVQPRQPFRQLIA